MSKQPAQCGLNERKRKPKSSTDGLRLSSLPWRNSPQCGHHTRLASSAHKKGKAPHRNTMFLTGEIVWPADTNFGNRSAEKKGNSNTISSAAPVQAGFESLPPIELRAESAAACSHGTNLALGAIDFPELQVILPVNLVAGRSAVSGTAIVMSFVILGAAHVLEAKLAQVNVF